MGWLLTCAWIRYKMQPRAIRRLIAVLCVVFVVERACSERHGPVRAPSEEEKAKVREVVKELGRKYDSAKAQPAAQQADLAKTAVQIGALVAREFGDDEDSEPPLFAVPFGAPPDDADAAKFSSSVFVSLYGKLAMADSKKIGIGQSGAGAAGPVEQARARHARLVIFGTVKGEGPSRTLEVTLAQAADGGVVWTHAYPLKGSDPAAVADDISAHLPPSGDSSK
jgi:TolB-like protein